MTFFLKTRRLISAILLLPVLTLTTQAYTLVDIYQPVPAENGVFLGQVAEPGSGDTYRYTWDSRCVANGAHTLYAVAYDNSLNSTQSETITITTENGISLSNLIVNPNPFSPDEDGIDEPVGSLR